MQTIRNYNRRTSYFDTGTDNFIRDTLWLRASKINFN